MYHVVLWYLTRLETRIFCIIYVNNEVVSCLCMERDFDLVVEKIKRIILGIWAVADILLWKDTKLSAGLLLGMTVLWFLFEVVEYNFVTLICHLSISSMLIFFIWCTGAEFFKWYNLSIFSKSFSLLIYTTNCWVMLRFTMLHYSHAY